MNLSSRGRGGTHNLFSRVQRVARLHLLNFGTNISFANLPQKSCKINSSLQVTLYERPNISIAIISCTEKPTGLSFHGPLLMHIINREDTGAMTSRTSFPMRYIRWGEEGVRTSNLRLSENQAIGWPPSAIVGGGERGTPYNVL